MRNIGNVSNPYFKRYYLFSGNDSGKIRTVTYRHNQIHHPQNPAEHKSKEETMKKRIMSLFVAASLAASAFSVTAAAESTGKVYLLNF